MDTNLIDVRPGAVLQIGRVGSGEAITYRFRKSYVSRGLPEGGNYAVTYTDPDGGVWPRVFTQDDEYVYWTVLQEDTQIEGTGSVEVSYLFGSFGAYHSEMWQTVVSESAFTPGDAPEQYRSWLDEASRVRAEVLTAASHATASEQASEEYAAQALTSAANAAESAQSASESAGDAAGAADIAAAARDEAISAESNAETAQRAAEAAQGVAESSAASSVTAAGSAGRAAGEAAQSATDADTRANAAERFAGDAWNAYYAANASAEQARADVESILGAKEQAVSAAESANQSMIYAGQSKEAAEAAKKTAEEAASTAVEQAGKADDYSASAAAYAIDSENEADRAEAAADAASGSAGMAQVAADRAEVEADRARNEANRAEKAAEEAAEDAAAKVKQQTEGAAAAAASSAGAAEIEADRAEGEANRAEAAAEQAATGAVGRLTIGLEQVIGMDPVTVLFTTEQLEIIGAHNILEIDTAQIGFPSCTWLKDTVTDEFTALRMDNYEFTTDGISFDGLNIIAIDNAMGAGQLFQYVDEGGMTPEERAELTSHEARLANLEAAAQGKLYREEVDDSVAYVKPVPAGALPYAAVTEVESVELDGVTYSPTAVLVHGINILPDGIIFETGAVKATDGVKSTTSATAGFKMTRTFIDVSAFRGMKITYSAPGNSSNYGAAFYTAASTTAFLSGQTIANGKTLTVPANASYARFSFAESNMTPMVVLGDSLPSPAVPYHAPDRYDVENLPVYVAVQSGDFLTVENDKGAPVPMPSSVTYAINVQEAIANE